MLMLDSLLVVLAFRSLVRLGLVLRFKVKPVRHWPQQYFGDANPVGAFAR